MDTLNLEQLKTDVHQAVLSKLDLEKLSSVDSTRARQAVASDGPGNPGRPQCSADRQRKGPDRIRSAGRGVRTGTAGAAAPGPLGLRHPGEPRRYGVRGAPRPAGKNRRGLPRRPASDAGDRPHCFAGRTPRGRILSHGGRPASGRLARQCHHSAAGAGRAVPVHPAVWKRPGGGGNAGEAAEHFAGDAGGAGGRGQSAHQPADLGRHGRRQDHLSEHHVELHSATASGSITIEDAAELQLQQENVVRLETRPRQRGRPGRSSPETASDQQPAYAPGPDHHRRGARRGSLRHAAGHEHRPRRLHDDHPRQYLARRAVAAGVHGGHGESESAGRARCASRSPRPSPSWCRSRA